ncbi:glycerate kinase [Corynebacterium aquilae]|uniref:glycerate kinase family protein n=1 Tax=Corynebacterium aquilae TaxID=203263 RepID=UPI00095195BD|nr:glycerate kinase [Corynebacterium aquilae]
MNPAAPIRVVICPDSFKGTCTATEVAHAIRTGWAGVRSDDEIVLAPMADGGEGTRHAFHLANPTQPVVELAELCGIETLTTLNPFGASTRPFGEQIARQLHHLSHSSSDNSHHQAEPTTPTTLYLGIGSSASTDCGAGMLQGMGIRILDKNGHDIADGLTGVATAEKIDITPAATVLSHLNHTQLAVITDVTAPLLGAGGAVQAFGSQKGLTPQDFPAAEAALERFAHLIADALPHTPPLDLPGAGAAGGVGFALACLGAQLLPGAEHVAQAIDLKTHIAHADVVITGEGRFDATSQQGKVPTTVLRLSQQHDTECLLIAGTIPHNTPTADFAASIGLTDIVPTEQALNQPRTAIAQAAAQLAQHYPQRLAHS